MSSNLTNLPQLTAPTNSDWLYIVDVSDTTDNPAGSSKKILRGDLYAQITGFTYLNNAITLSLSDNSTYQVVINTMTGLTINGVLSATTYANLPLGVWTTGSTGDYSIKAVNDSGLDATGNYAVAEGVGTTASGGASHAEGTGTIASGESSHAEGDNTRANGSRSHAEGSGTEANGSGSHAEGTNTTANTTSAHAEGSGSIARGPQSHAEGSFTQANASSSHAEGVNTIANGLASHAEGGSTTTIGENSHAEGYGVITGWKGFSVISVVNGLITLNSSYGNITSGFTGTQVILDDEIYTYNTVTFSSTTNTEILLDDTLVNAGGVVADLSDLYRSEANINMGDNSHAEGSITKAIGQNSHAEGGGTRASGLRSHAEGYQTTASGVNSHAEGNETIASGYASHAEGTNTTASGRSSHGQGENTTASGDYSHAEGSQTTATGDASHAEGLGTIAHGEKSHAEGDNTKTYGSDSHAEGNITQTGFRGFSIDSVVNGLVTLDSSYGNVTSEFVSNQVILTYGLDQILTYNTVTFSSTTNTQILLDDISINDGFYIADLTRLNSQYADFYIGGANAHSEGSGAIAIGNSSHAEGAGTIAIGNTSHAEGGGTTASGEYSHAEGYYSIAQGYGSHAEGGWDDNGTIFSGGTALGNASHAEGINTTASGLASHAEGRYTTASGYFSHAEGFYTTAFGNLSHAEGEDTMAIGNKSHVEGTSTMSGSLAYRSNQLGNTNRRLILDDIYGDITSQLGGDLLLTDQFNRDQPILIKSTDVINITFSSTTNTEIFFSNNINLPFAYYSDCLISKFRGNNIGDSNYILGYNSHAEGEGTNAFGYNSHAEGEGTNAFGYNSHAEGEGTLALGRSSHAGGDRTTASGQASFIHSAKSFVLGERSAVLGGENITGTTDDTVYVPYFNIQSATTDNNLTEILVIDTNGDVKKRTVGSIGFTGGTVSGATIFTGGLSANTFSATTYYNLPLDVFTTGGTYDDGTITFTNNSGGTFNVSGLVTGDTYWTSGSTGNYSIKAKNDSGLDATGNYAVAEGYDTLASGYASHAEGDSTKAGWKGFTIDSVVDGLITLNSSYGDVTNEFYSNQVIIDNNLYNYNTVTFSSTTNTEILLDNITVNSGTYVADINVLNSQYADNYIGNGSHAEGRLTKALGDYSHTEGLYSLALDNYSHAEGYGTFASGWSSHAEGGSTIASGFNAHSEGNATIASGDYSHAEGTNTLAGGENSHAEGGSTTASGNYSHAEGQFTVASGVSSHAEGYYTTAIGNYSHAEGYYTIASNEGSHSEGILTISSGYASHAEGNLTTASGQNSSASGYYSVAQGDGSHAEGGWNDNGDILSGGTALGKASHAEGSETIAGWKGFSIDLIVNGLITLNSSYGDITGEFTGNKVILDTKIYTYNTVTFSSTTNTEILLDDITVNTGTYVTDLTNLNSQYADTLDVFGRNTHAEGNNTKSIGVDSHAEGYYTVATGAYGAHAEGDFTTASGDRSHAEGERTTASGNRSHAEGELTTASGMRSHAEGYYSRAIGHNSHAEGNNTRSLSNASHAEGSNTTAIGENSHAEGQYTISGWRGFTVDSVVNGLVTINSSYGDITSEFTGNKVILDERICIYNTVTFSSTTNTEILLNDLTINGGYLISDIDNLNSSLADNTIGVNGHAEGFESKALGENSPHAEGIGTIASGNYSSHAEGQFTIASGNYSHAEGYGTIASGDGSHTEGQGNIASGNYSHAEGNGTIASGDNSHAEGTGTIASGYSSHAEGGSTTAYGWYSHAGGDNSIASGDTSFIHSRNSLVTGNRSAVLGGIGITGTSNDTVYVPYLNIQSATTDNAITEVLVIDTSGNVKKRTVGSVDTYTTGFTFDVSNYDLTIQQTNGQTDLIVNLGILSSDVTITGGTYNPTTGIAEFTNNTGGTFSVSGFLTGMTDTYVSGFTYSDNILTIKQTAGQPDLTVNIDTLTGLTINGNLTVTGQTTTGSISATTYYNLPASSDTYTTGGTYNSTTGIATFTNNSGGTFNVSGFYTGSTDNYTTGYTYSDNTFTIKRNNGLSDLTTTINTMTGLTINGDLTVTGQTTTNSLSATTITATTITATDYQNLPFTDNQTIEGFISGSTTYVRIKDVVSAPSGGTRTFEGNVNVNNGFTATTISATTYYNLPASVDTYTTGFTFNASNYDLTIKQNNGQTDLTVNLGVLSSDVTITGGTYNSTTGVATFTNNTGGTFDVSGFLTGMTDTYVSGFTYSNNNLTIKQTAGRPDLTVNIDTLTGLTINGNLIVTGQTTTNSLSANTITATTITATNYENLPFTDNQTVEIFLSGGTEYLRVKDTISAPSGGTRVFEGNVIVNSGFTANTISATTYYNLPASSDTYTTGGTYNNLTGIATFTNNSGGTFNVTGFYTGATDNYTTGYTYDNNTFTIKRNNGLSDLTTTINTMTGLTINGNLNVTGQTTTNSLSASTITATTITATDYQNLPFTDNQTIEGFVSGSTTYVRIKDVVSAPSGGTRVFEGNVVINSGFTANTISATTYYNLPASVDTYTTGFTFNVSNYDLTIKQNNGQTDLTVNLGVLSSDMTVTGGTYNPTTGVATFTNNTGGTFDVSGFLTGMTDTYVSGFTYSNNNLTIKQTAGKPDLTVNIDTLTGLTINGNLIVTGQTITNSLSASTITATTITADNYENLPFTDNQTLEIIISGGTEYVRVKDTISAPSGGTRVFEGNVVVNSGFTANTISATTYYNLPMLSGAYLPLSGGTVTGGTSFTNGLTANTISATTLQFDTTYTGTVLPGQIAWDSNFGTLQQGLVGGNVTQKIGETSFAMVKNVETTTINKGQVVYIFGATGDKISVKLASNTGDTTSSKTLGIAAENIAANQNGLIITQGTLDGLNLESYNAGDILWLGSVPGQMTTIKQYAPYHLVFIGVVQRANNGNGQLYVKPQNGYEIEELHNVLATGATYGDLLVYSAYNGSDIWVNTKTLTGDYNINGNLNVTGGTQSIFSGKVGIGLTNPASQLHVRSTAIPSDREIIAQFDVSDDSSYFRISNVTGVDGNFIPSLEGYNSTERIAMFFLANGATDSGTEPLINYNARIGQTPVVTRPLFNWSNFDSVKMTMLANGNLGIGTETPSYKLDVSGTTRLKGVSAELTIDDATWAELKYGANNYFRAQGDQAIISGPLIRLFDGSQETMRISGGSVSIGTTVTSPTAKLHINNTGDTNSFLVEDENNPDNTPFIIDNQGRVGIGTINPLARLQVDGDSYVNGGSHYIYQAVNTTVGHLSLDHSGVQMWRFGVFNDNTSTLSIGKNILDNNTRLFNITTGGNVGIGTTTPTAKLHVSGDTRITGTLTATTISATTYQNLPKIAFSPMNVSVCDTAPTAATTQYYYQSIAEVTSTLSKVKLWGFSGSDIVLFGIYRGTLQGTMTLIGQAKGTCGVGPNELTLSAETGQNLTVTAGEDIVIGYFSTGSNWKTVYNTGISDIYFGLINTTDITTMPATPTGTATGIRFACTLY